MSREAQIVFYDAGAYECPIDGCGCSHGSFSYDFGKYRDGSEVFYLILSCEWGHTTTLHLNNHDGAILYGVETEEEEGWDK